MSRYGAKTIRVVDPRDEAPIEITYWVGCDCDEDSIDVDYSEADEMMSTLGAGRVARGIERIRNWARTKAGRTSIAAFRLKALSLDVASP